MKIYIMNFNIKIKIVIVLIINSYQVNCQTCESQYAEQQKFKEIYDYLSSHKFAPSNNPFTALSYSYNNYTYPNNANEA